MSVMLVNSGDYADNAFDGDRSNSGDREHAGDTGKSGNTVGNAAGGRESLTSYAKYASNSRRDGIWPIPTAMARLRRKRSEWLKQVQRELGERNGDGLAVPAIAFQHIPPQEFYDCLREVPAYTPNAVEGARTFAGHCYVLNRDVCRPGSRLGEAIGCADENVGEVQALRDAAAISRCSAGMTIRTRSSGTCMTLILATRRPAALNAMVRNRGCEAFDCSNSAKTIRSAT